MDRPASFVPSLAARPLRRTADIEDLEKFREGQDQASGSGPALQEGQEVDPEPTGPATTTRPRGGPGLAQESEPQPQDPFLPQDGQESPQGLPRDPQESEEDPATAEVEQILAVRIKSTNPRLPEHRVASLVRDTMEILKGR